MVLSVESFKMKNQRFHLEIDSNTIKGSVGRYNMVSYIYFAHAYSKMNLKTGGIPNHIR